MLLYLWVLHSPQNRALPVYMPNSNIRCRANSGPFLLACLSGQWRLVLKPIIIRLSCTQVRCPIVCAFVNGIIKPILTYHSEKKHSLSFHYAYLFTWMKLENWNNYWNMIGYKMHVISIGAMIGYWMLTSLCKTIANDDVKSLPMATPISKQKCQMKTGLLYH